MQFLHWQVYMGHLAPFGEERQDIRFASVVAAIWNVQIAKWTGKDSTPQFRDIRDLVLRFGDTPEYLPPGPKKLTLEAARSAFQTVASYFTGGLKKKG